MALQRSGAIEYLFEQLVDRLESMMQQKFLSKEVVEYLISQFFVNLHTSMEKGSMQVIAESDFNKAVVVEDIQDYLETCREQGTNGSLPRWAYIESRKCSEEHGISYEQSNELYQSMLANGVFRAKLENLRILIARYQGNFHELQPKDPMFSGLDNKTGLQAKKPEPTIQELANIYISKKSKTSWNPKTKADHTRVLNWFMELVGNDISISVVTKDEMIKYRDALLELPKNFVKSKELKDLKFGKFEELGEHVQRVTPQTARKYLEMLKAFFQWCVDHEYIVVVPGKKVSVKTTHDKADARHSFSKEQLKDIFSAPVFTGCASKSRRHEKGLNVYRDGKFWIPLIGVHTGMRLGEIVQLLTDDIKIEDGTYYFDVTTLTSDDSELKEKEVKSLKTPQSQRKIPIHPELVKIGFIDHVYRDGNYLTVAAP